NRSQAFNRNRQCVGERRRVAIRKLARMLSNKSSRRASCDRCRRPMSHCLCAYIPAVPSSTRVLVLQHPDETKHPLNTGRLAVLGLQRGELWVGERFPRLDDVIASVEQALLLFPSRDEDAPAPAPALRGKESTLLIVPDGTWRKARRVVSENPVLSTLPRV